MTAPRPLTSIVILTRNQLACTKQCVDGIARCTPEPHELVFVDNGSTDGTLEYLRSIPGAVVIDNDRNIGFGAGCNMGIAASLGERILLLNNDVVPTAGWLGALHDALDADPTTMLVGPRTNRIAGDQRVDGVGYDQETLDGLGEWSADWCASRCGERTPIMRLVGFCILMERAVVEHIGGFDLRYDIGNFEDDDLCLRAGVAGMRCVVAQDSFVHHFGSRTFSGEQLDQSAHMVANYRRFIDAWGLELADVDPKTFSYPAGKILAQTAWDDARHFAPLLGERDSGERVDVAGARSRIAAVCCDRWDPDGTRVALETALSSWGPRDDVTVLVRVDPRDTVSEALLEQTADERERVAGLPDVMVVQARETDDRLALRAVDEVVVAGRGAWARAQLAQRMGVTVRPPCAERPSHLPADRFSRIPPFRSS